MVGSVQQFLRECRGREANGKQYQQQTSLHAPIIREAASHWRRRFSISRRCRTITAPEAAESCRYQPAESWYPAPAASRTESGSGPVQPEPGWRRRVGRRRRGVHTVVFFSAAGR